MPLSAGTQLGPYQIISLLGAGGMGEVYKARDTRLDRTVAIKVLPSHRSDQPDLRERFEREARAVASLNHPHICTLFDIGREQDTEFLVMEYLDGETLAERLKKGPLPLDQVLRHAIDIAGALDKAHAAGIAHRDVKPSNIMLTKSGAKLLDFGLAKRGAEKNVPGSLSQLPTNADLTAQGSILGTLQYMSPEQLEGQDADARSDIFGFGTTLYEMVTGVKAFEGKSQVSLMAAILEHEPRPISSIQPLSPPLLDRLVRKCLAKSPQDRWQSAADVAEGLNWIRDGVPASSAVTAVSPGAARWKIAALVAVIVVLAGALVFNAMNSRRGESDDLLWFSIVPPESRFPVFPAGAISPDGRNLVFSAVNAAGAETLWLRSLDSPNARELPGTATDLAHVPFWSPDGRSIGFFANGKLQRINVDGGTPQDLAPAPNPRGATWGIDGTIIFAPVPNAGLLRVAAAGGAVTPLRVLDRANQESGLMYPHFLPDGKHYLYFVLSPDPKRAGVYAGSVDSSDSKRVADYDSRAEYADGFLFYGAGEDLFAQAFDISRLQVTGEGRRIASDLGSMYGETQNRAFSVSVAGRLTYTARSYVAPSQFAFFDRSGKRLEAVGPQGQYLGLKVAPDQRKAILENADYRGGRSPLLLLEFSSGTASPLNIESDSGTAAWAADSVRVGYIRFVSAAFSTIAVNSGVKETLASGPAIVGAYAQSWSPDGSSVILTTSTEGQSDMWIVPLDGKGKPAPFLQTPANEFRAEISPNGRWIAYVSNESGRDEINVVSFPQPGQKKRISADGGNFPTWRPDGRELYYLAPSAGNRQKLMVVGVDPASSEFVASRPQSLFEAPPMSLNPRRAQFAAFGNGDRFLMNALAEDTKPRAITVIQNWPALLKQK